MGVVRSSGVGARREDGAGEGSSASLWTARWAALRGALYIRGGGVGYENSEDDSGDVAEFDQSSGIFVEEGDFLRLRGEDEDDALIFLTAVGALGLGFVRPGA
jgi:hypothetical protein